MDDPILEAKRENFRKQVAASNEYHQKKLRSPEEVSKRLNYQDKTRGDPNSNFKGVGRRVGTQPPPPPPQHPYLKSPPQKKVMPKNPNPEMSAKRVNPSHAASRNVQPHRNFQPPPQNIPSHVSHLQNSEDMQHESNFEGIGHVVKASRSKKKDPNDEILPSQSSKYHNQQGRELKTWHNILNDPMDEMQAKCLSLINENRAKCGKPPVAFSRSCTLRVQEQVEKVSQGEIKLESFHTGLQERAEQIPRCKKANEVFAVVSKKDETRIEIEPNPISRPKQQPLKTAAASRNPAAKPPAKTRSVPYQPNRAVPYYSNHNAMAAAPAKPKPFDPVKALFDKWMEKSTMRTTILGNYQVIGISFADSNDGSSLIGAAIFAQIS